ncbi:MAG: mechanosensitive ion channel [Chloroflexota bacterium]
MNLFGLSTDQLNNLYISIGIVFVAAIAGRPILIFILDRLIKRITGHTKTTLDDVVIDTIRGSLFWLVFLGALQFAIARLDFLQEMTTLNIDDIFFVFYSLIGLTVTWQLVNNLSVWYATEIAPKTESNLDEQLVPFLRRLALILVGAIALIILLGHFNIEISGLVTTLGIGSLAIALAAQAALSDTISGFMIMIDRPFRIGDRIELQDLSTWGDVVDIGLRSTRIRTRDNRMVIVPNSTIAKSLIVNHSFPDSKYRIQMEIGVEYGVDLEEVRQILITAVEKVSGVDENKPVEALFLHFGDAALIFRVRWWIESYVDTRRMFDKVNTAMYNALTKAGIDIPYPQREVSLRVLDRDIENISKAIKK